GTADPHERLSFVVRSVVEIGESLELPAGVAGDEVYGTGERGAPEHRTLRARHGLESLQRLKGNVVDRPGEVHPVQEYRGPGVAGVAARDTSHLDTGPAAARADLLVVQAGREDGHVEHRLGCDGPKILAREGGHGQRHILQRFLPLARRNHNLIDST